DVGLAVAVNVAGAGDRPPAHRRHRANRATADHAREVHQPDHHLPRGLVVPKDVALTVAVEVTGADDGPVGRNGTGRAGAEDAEVNLPDHPLPGGAVAQEDVVEAGTAEGALSHDRPGVRGRPKRAAADDARAVHVPAHHLPGGGVAPEDVAPAVKVDI